MSVAAGDAEHMAGDVQDGPRVNDQPDPEPLTGVVVHPGAQIVPVPRRALAVRARNRLAEISKNPAVVATAAVGATVVAEAVVEVARRVLQGSAPGPLEIRGTVVHHVVHHHVIHILDARRALPPG
jgi:hypothetical protein